MEKVNTLVPVHFQKVNQFDDRFVQVKIWLMHTGLNYNGSIFEKESVEKAMPTLKNTPILAYIQDDGDGNKDFAGHELELVVEDGEYKFKYLGKAVGVITADCNPRWEKKAGDNGELLDYLVVDGLLWTKFDDAVDILNDSGEVGQSMELHSNYDGHFNEDGHFVFTNFSFFGACLLGKGVAPAMQKSSVELFSSNTVVKTIEEKMEEFKLYSKEVNANMTLEELLAKYSITAEQLNEKGINAEEFSIEELEVKITEAFSEEVDNQEVELVEPETNHEAESGTEETPEGSVADEVDTEEDVETSEGENSPEGETAPEGDFETPEGDADETRVYHKFALSHDDIRNQLWDRVNDYVEEKGLGERWDFWIHKVYDDHIIMQDEYNTKLYKVNYSKENDVISLTDYVEVFAQYLTIEEKGALELLRNNYETLETEVSQLKEFKRKSQEAEHEAQAEDLFEQFGLEEADIKDIKDNVHNFTIKEIEDKLFAILGRKNFSVQSPKPNKVAITLEGNADSEKSYMKLFAKHGLN